MVTIGRERQIRTVNNKDLRLALLQPRHTPHKMYMILRQSHRRELVPLHARPAPLLLLSLRHPLRVLHLVPLQRRRIRTLQQPHIQAHQKVVFGQRVKDVRVAVEDRGEPLRGVVALQRGRRRRGQRGELLRPHPRRRVVYIHARGVRCVRVQNVHGVRELGRVAQRRAGRHVERGPARGFGDVGRWDLVLRADARHGGTSLYCSATGYTRWRYC